MRWWITSAALALAACHTPTQLLVVVDTDLEPGVELSTVAVTVSTDGPGVSHEFDVRETELPFSFGVSPGGADDARVRVGTVALDLDGAPISQHVVETRFVPGRVLRVDVPLSRACVGAELECADAESCVLGACVPVEVDPASLPEGDPGGDPARLFEGPREAPPDAGTDGGVDPPACEEGTPCQAGDPCRPGSWSCSGAEPVCEPGEPLPEGTVCGDGRACDAEAVCGRQLP